MAGDEKKKRTSRKEERPPTPGSLNNRRSFLKAAGFSIGSALLSHCQQAPITEVIPYRNTPEELLPGEPIFYASTCGGCSASCGTLVRVIDGRPIKIEGNEKHPLSRGALCAVGQAAILELYDSHRLRSPILRGRVTSWEAVDAHILQHLSPFGDKKRLNYLITGTVHSPTLQSVIKRWLRWNPENRWIQYDTIPASAIRRAHRKTHGMDLLPRYNFSEAEVIVGLDADFLSTWISPVEYSQGYRDGRTLEGSRLRFSTHYQFEPRLTVTGAQADERIPVHPGQMTEILTHLAARLCDRQYRPVPFDPPPLQAISEDLLDRMVSKLWAARGKSLVVCGSQDESHHLIVNYINHLLRNYGRTVDLYFPSHQKRGDESAFDDLMEDLARDSVETVLISGVNPVFDLPFGDTLARHLEQVPLVVAIATHDHETARVATAVCPPHHPLETWGDAAPTARVCTIQQPMIRPIGSTRSLAESLVRWMGEPQRDLEIVKSHWEEVLYPRRFGLGTFREFWEESLHDGVARLQPSRTSPAPFQEEILEEISPSDRPHEPGSPSLVLYPPANFFDATHSQNPWLQELPDPITKVTWGNFLALAPETARRLSLEEGDLVRIETEEAGGLELPLLHQPGQHPDVAAVALGYGARGTERFRRLGPDWLEARFRSPAVVGKRANQFILRRGSLFSFTRPTIRLRRTGKAETLIRAQKFLSAEGEPEGRPERESPFRRMSLESLLSTRPQAPAAPANDLWPEDHLYERSWGMVIDLGACTGCSACVIACQAENNIPTVGPDEVLRNRDLHWLRVDVQNIQRRGREEIDFQPMLCQHCDDAPCETVCPVLATVHSEEGLNQQIYNRCVGTRYCANNCPYKVRAFNWFDYSSEERLENLQLNPHVTVRSRGVMEKCTFCVQRIQKAKIEATIEDRVIADGTVQTACQQTCPARAISFGDLNDPTSRVSELMKSPRGYRVLGDLGTRPSVTYLAVVKNREASGGEDDF